MSLYQLYRPKNFSDVIGQDFIKKVLSNTCIKKSFHHGYIFFWFHGVGKTTLARIFSQAINCTNITSEWNPCHKCENCLSYANWKMIDVIEIDAASFTWVDNIREVIDHAKFTPTQWKYKIYIIDEVHMLSKGAFNALLKTLEEPPSHVIFLLATTEIHKVPDTILSRVIRFDLTKIGAIDIKKLLTDICQKQWIQAEEGALTLISHRARGSVRDALTMLEKCIMNNAVTESYVTEALHLIHPNFLKNTFDVCIEWKAQDIQSIVSSLEEKGIDVREFSSQMTEWITENIHHAFENNTFAAYRDIFDLFTQVYAQSRQVSLPMDLLKMSLYSRIRSGTLDGIPLSKENIDNPPEDGIKQEESRKISQPIEKNLENQEKNISQNNASIDPSVAKNTNIDTEYLDTSEVNTTIKDTDTLPWSVFSLVNYIETLQKLWIKNTIIPLLKTADIQLKDEELIIISTSFCIYKCRENTIYMILENAANMYGAKKVNLVIAETQKSENSGTDEPPIHEIAENIFQ